MRRTSRSSCVSSLCLACRDYNLERHIAESGRSGSGRPVRELWPGAGHRRGDRAGIRPALQLRPRGAGGDRHRPTRENKFGADIVDITPDPLGHRLTVTFKSGWRTAIVPIDDGKTGDETKIPSGMTDAAPGHHHCSLSRGCAPYRGGRGCRAVCGLRSGQRSNYQCTFRWQGAIEASLANGIACSRPAPRRIPALRPESGRSIRTRFRKSSPHRSSLPRKAMPLGLQANCRAIGEEVRSEE